jgi:hypothetical protein
MDAPTALDPAANGRLTQAFDVGRCLQWGWEAFKGAGLTLWLGGFLMNCTSGGGGGGSGYTPSTDDTNPGELPDLSQWVPDFSDPMVIGITVGVVVMVMVLILVVTAIQAWLEPGWIKAQLSSLERGEAGADILFSGGSHFGPMFRWKLLTMAIRFGVGAVVFAPSMVLAAAAVMEESIGMGLGAGGLAVVLAVPAFIWLNLGLVMGAHAVVLDGVDAGEALERSWSLAKGNRLTLFFVLFAYGVVKIVATVAGLMMLCVGVFLTGPAGRALTDVAFTAGYLRTTRGLEVSEDWAVARAG